MIHLTRLRGEDIIINANLIESVEATPDTVISMATGKKFMVSETIGEVVERVIDYQRQVGHPMVIPHHTLQDEEISMMESE